MEFEVVIREAGINPEDYPFASKVPVIIYDDKNRQVTSNVHFDRSLFSRRPDSFKAFQAFLDYLENCFVLPLSVHINFDYVFIIESYTAKGVHIFRR